MRRLAFVILAAALVTTGPALAGAVDVSGDWSLTVNSEQGVIPATLSLKQDGEKLTGTITGGDGGTMPIEGTVKESEITFSFYYGDIPVTMSGTVDGDTVKGSFSAGESGGDWTGTRKPKGH
jgi:hypothetical protein